MLAVEENFGLDDGDETGVLADRGITGETVRAVGHRGAGGAVGDGHHGPPLAEARALLVVRGGAVGEVVETLAPGLGGVGEGTETLVHLDTGVDALRVEGVHEGGAVGAGLVQGFFEKNRTTDVLAEVGSGNKKLAVAATVLFDVLDTDTFKAGAARGVGLVHSEDTLAGHGHLGLWVEGEGGLGQPTRTVTGKRSRSRRCRKFPAQDLSVYVTYRGLEELIGVLEGSLGGHGRALLRGRRAGNHALTGEGEGLGKSSHRA